MRSSASDPTTHEFLFMAGSVADPGGQKMPLKRDRAYRHLGRREFGSFPRTCRPSLIRRGHVAASYSSFCCRPTACAALLVWNDVAFTTTGVTNEGKVTNRTGHCCA